MQASEDAAEKPSAAPAERTEGRPRHRTVLRWAWRVLVVAGLGLAVYELEGNAGELVIAGEELGHLHLEWVLIGAVLELASFVAFALSQVRLLRVGGARPGTVPVTQQALAAQALANCLPGGPAASATFSYRAFRRMRVDQGLSAWVILVNNLLYISALCVIVVVAAEVAGRASNPNVPDLRPYAVGVLAGLLLLLGAGVALHRRSRLGEVTQWLARRLRVLQRHKAQTMGVERVLAQFTAVGASRRDLGTCTLLLTLTWLTDAACLGLAFPAVGAATPVRGLLIAYAAAQLAAALPVTPGGLGVVEGSLTLALVAYGGAGNATLGAVLLYRILSYWSIMPLGLVSYLFLRRRAFPADSAAAAGGNP